MNFANGIRGSRYNWIQIQSNFNPHECLKSPFSYSHRSPGRSTADVGRVQSSLIRAVEVQATLQRLASGVDVFSEKVHENLPDPLGFLADHPMGARAELEESAIVEVFHSGSARVGGDERIVGSQDQ